MTGVLLVNKPSGFTSHDVVAKIRKACGIRRVGHTGTLDPAATGLLLICVGTATRLSEFLTGMDKVYEGAMRFGIVTDSYDLDGKVVEEHAVPPIDQQSLQEICNRYTGAIEQVPPMVSAVKIDGERLYKKARKGEVVDRPARHVNVFKFEIKSCDGGEALFELRCSSGTYARSLCHDVGQDLGCGAALARLCRTAVGKHRLADARTLDELQTPEEVERAIIPIGEVLDMPAVTVPESMRQPIASGASVACSAAKGECPPAGEWVQLKDKAGDLLALGEVRLDQQIQPKRVFCG